MSDRIDNNLIPDFDDYSTEELLNAARRRRKTSPFPPEPEVPAETAEPLPDTEAVPAYAPPESAEEIAERSRRKVAETLGESLSRRRESVEEVSPPREDDDVPAATVVFEPVADAARPDDTAQEPEPEPDTGPDETPASAPTELPEDEEDHTLVWPRPAENKPDRPRVTRNEDGTITLLYETDGAPVSGDSSAPEAEPEEDDISEDGDEPEDEEEEYAEEDSEPAERPRKKTMQKQAPSFMERFLAPAVRLIATRLAQRQMQQTEAENWPEPVDIRETPELTPRNAGKYYTSLLRPLKLRMRIAFFLCVILVWIALQFPMAGMLRSSLPLQAGVSAAITLAVMLTALDVFTTGLRQLFELHPGAESLASIAAILSCLDGALVLFGIGENLPYCAIGAVALTAGLWGEQLTCRARRRTFKTAAASKKPTVLTAEKTGSKKIRFLQRSDRGSTEGIVRRSESQDLCQTIYAVAAPFLLIGALLLSVAASLAGEDDQFLHTFSALVSVSASFAAFFSFPLPFAIATRRLKNTGAALAGYIGCADIGKTRRIVITDEDLFPPGTMKFAEINVQEGVFLGKVVSYTASLIDASGSGVSSLFAELVERRGYHIPGVVDFVCHEGGGLSGLISGERVLVGSAGFMNLMGIRLPQNLQTKNSICTAISGELVGVFVIDYIPVTSVQEALVTLLRGRTQTVFAIRDFNITPRMIAQLFRMPTDNFNFPSFRERYRIASPDPESGTPVNAVITRSGMLPLVEAAETGRKVYRTCRINTILSLAGTIIGMIIMFLLCRAGSFDTASVGNVLSFMLLWSLPVLFLSVGQVRQ